MPGRAGSGSRTRSRWLRIAWWVMPYAVAALVIGAILRTYSLQRIEQEMARGHTLPLIPLAIVTYVGSLLFIATADNYVLRCKLGPERAPGFVAMAKGKAASVLLHIVHYALGQGAYATWLARRTGLSVVRAGGLILYIVASELGSICLYAALVIVIGRPSVPHVVLPVVGGIALGIAGSFLLVPSTRLERVTVLETWSRVGRRRGLVQLCIRLGQHAVTTTGTWLAARWFGLDIPLGVMLSYMPVILVVAALPVNVAGFGAVQGAWLLLTPWAAAEKVLAFSVVWQALSGLAVIARGLPFFRGVLADIRRGRAEAAGPITPAAP